MRLRERTGFGWGCGEKMIGSGGENNRGNLTEKDSCLFGGNDIRFFLRLILRTILRGILG